MTDRTRMLTVILEEEYRVDDAENITAAIAMIKGVLSVEVNVLNPSERLAIRTAENNLRRKLWDVLGNGAV